MAKAKSKATADAVEILHRRYYAGKARRLGAWNERERTTTSLAS
jgi:hypothetical protein